MRDFNAKWRQDSGLSVCMECEMPKITIGITGLRENLSRDVVIGEPVWGASTNNWIFSTASIPIA